MSKLIYTLIFLFPLVLLSCSDDKDGDTNTNKTYKVRYEASCDNPNITLRILYSTKNTDMENVENDAKEVFIKSPFSVELEMKQSDFCYISVQQHLGENDLALEDVNYSTAVFVDGTKKTESSNKTASISYHVLGFE